MSDNFTNLPGNEAFYGSIYQEHRSSAPPSSVGDHKVLPLDGDTSLGVTKINTGLTNVYSFAEGISEVESPDTYEYQAGASFDTIFSPYTTYFSNNSLPSFEIPTNKTDINSLKLNPWNPNNELSLFYADTGGQLYNISLTTSGSPTSDESGKLNSPSGWMNYGHGFNWATMGTGQYGSYDFDANFTEEAGSGVEVENIRAIAIRTPSVWTGWGWTTEGNPVPADTGDPTKFAPDAFRNVSNFKTGPLDIRWDVDRKVWTGGGGATKISLVKVTNTFNPACFSYEVDRSNTRAQYARNSPSNMITFTDSDSAIYDPEQVAYDANSNNAGCTEQLNYDGIDFPHYEAFIIRQTTDVVGNEYYNIWTQDCQDCGTVNNQCTSGTFPRHGSTGSLIQNKKILIENPLNQAMEVGDLAFTVDTGRKRKVNTGQFSGGSGTSASGEIVTDSSGNATFNVTNGGSGYSNGGFGIISSGSICVNLDLTFSAGALSAGTLSPTSGFDHDKTYPVTVYPSDATADTESLSIHWIMQAEFKSQQVVTHVECDGGILQNCTTKIQTQGFKTCEYCGEDTTLINSF